MIVTVCGPSSRLSSTPVIVNVAEAWLAGMTTLVGTLASDESLRVNETLTAAAMSVLLRVTVPVVVPPFSASDPGATVTLSVS